MESVYIHIPFCKSICSYCDFCKLYYQYNIVNKYLDELSNEIKKNYKKEVLKTIYIGGGTPSSLCYEQLNKLFSIIKMFKLQNNYEFTIEVNINDITTRFLELCHSNGVNRLSVGIETVNKKFYKYLNRYNDENDIIEKIELSKKYFDNINIDLMYGFEKETLEDLKKDLDFISKLDVQHISIYSLIIEEHTKLYIEKANRVDEQLDSEMYYYILNYLKKIGFDHYEISNFSKKGYKSVHNLYYWNNLNYYGFGLGASGYIDNIRYTNTRSITNYLKGEYLLNKEIIDDKTKMEEEMICGLRKTEGVSKNIFLKKYKKDIKDVFDIDCLLEKKLLLENDNYIFIPEDKLYISNSILINFIL